MASDILTFAQGQTATLTAQFVTTVGMPINVPDATIEIFGPSASVILPATAMTLVVTGLYFYEYVIPNSLAEDTYTVRFTGTVLGTPSATTIYLRIVAPGSFGSDVSQSASLAVAAMERYIDCAQHVPIEAELGRVISGREKVQFQWPRWNLSNPIIRRNDRILDTGFTLDYDTGSATFAGPLHETDKVDATYNFRFFTNEQLLGFLNDALSMINNEPPGSSYTLDNIPDTIMGTLLKGASANALQSIMFCMLFQKESTIFGGLERAEKVFSQFQTLKENHEKVFEAEKRKFKISRWPRPGIIVTPEFTLPGGRCLGTYTSSIYVVDGEKIQMTIKQAFDCHEAGKSLSVLSYSFDTKAPTFASVSKIWASKPKQVWLLRSMSGHSIRTSAEHLFYANGKFIPMSQLNPGDDLISLRSSHVESDKVLETIRTDEYAPMYDIEVPDMANLFADGIMCHNSRWFRYLFSGNVG